MRSCIASGLYQGAGEGCCQQQRELVPRLQHPLIHHSSCCLGLPKQHSNELLLLQHRAALQRVNTSSSSIRDMCLHQQYIKGRLQWKRIRPILAKKAQIPHFPCKILKAMSDCGEWSWKEVTVTPSQDSSVPSLVPEQTAAPFTEAQIPAETSCCDMRHIISLKILLKGFFLKATCNNLSCIQFAISSTTE